MVSFNPRKRADVVLKVVWNGTMDRQGTCFQLTGRLQRKNVEGTAKHRRGQGAPKRPHDRQPATYAKARQEMETYR